MEPIQGAGPDRKVRTEEQQRKLLEGLEKDFKNQINNFCAKVKRQELMNAKLCNELDSMEATFDQRFQTLANH